MSTYLSGNHLLEQGRDQDLISACGLVVVCGRTNREWTSHQVPVQLVEWCEGLDKRLCPLEERYQNDVDERNQTPTIIMQPRSPYNCNHITRCSVTTGIINIAHTIILPLHPISQSACRGRPPITPTDWGIVKHAFSALAYSILNFSWPRRRGMNSSRGRNEGQGVSSVCYMFELTEKRPAYWGAPETSLTPKAREREWGKSSHYSTSSFSSTAFVLLDSDQESEEGFELVNWPPVGGTEKNTTSAQQ